MKILSVTEYYLMQDWANRETWDGSFGHAPHCGAIPQTVRGFENRTHPCTCGRPGIPKISPNVVTDPGFVTIED